jgi:hypothetical protein
LTAEEVQKDVTELRNATHGMGTDEAKIIQVLSNRSTPQLLQIAQSFQQQFSKRLVDVIDKEVSGNFKLLCLALLKSEGELQAGLIKEAIVGDGTDESLLIETMVGKTNQQLAELSSAYSRLGGNLLQDIKGDTSGKFETFFTVLLNGRQQCAISAATDAEALYKAGEKKLGTDEKTFINIFCNRTEEHLKAVFVEYRKKYNKDISKVVESEFSGKLEDALLSIVNIINNRHHYLASLCNKALAGIGTYDKMLIRTIVQHRGPFTLPAMKQVYKELFGKSLVDAIKSDCSGDYKKLLVAICEKF